jgi:hypothetical protein
MSKPAFDPSKPFEPAGKGRPAFDPSRPFQATEAPGRLEAFGRGAAQGVTFGLGDELWGGIRAIGDSLPVALGGDGREELGFLDHYRRNRDETRANNKKAEDAHGGYYLAGNLAGGIATVPLIPGAQLGAGAKLAQLAKAGAKVGAIGGAAGGFGASDTDLTTLDQREIGQAGLDTLSGAVLGGSIGGAAPVVGRGLSKGLDALKRVAKGGYVTPTPEAGRLAAEGVDLTLGRMDPSSTFGKVEELASNGVLGGSLKGARDRTAATARDALLRKAGAPGAAPPTRGAPLSSQIDEVAAGYGQLYDDALDGVRLQPEQYMGKGKWRGLLTDQSLEGSAKTKGALELAAAAKDIDASPSVRRRALSWLENEAQSLAPTKSGPNAGTVEAKSVHALRTRLRDKIRNLGDEGDDRQLREIYERAEDFTSELLEGQLPPKQAAALRTADAGYRNVKALRHLEKGRAFVTQEFTPDQLLNSIKKTGATPELEALARDAHSVLNATYQPTGIQVAATEALPILKRAGPLWAAIANSSKGVRAHALGQGSLPAWANAPIRAAQGVGAGARALTGERSQAALIRALSLARDRRMAPTDAAPLRRLLGKRPEDDDGELAGR